MIILIGQIWLNKKNPFEYIIPPPTTVSQNNRINTFTLFVLDDVRVLPLCIKSSLCVVYRQIVPHLYISFQWKLTWSQKFFEYELLGQDERKRLPHIFNRNQRFTPSIIKNLALRDICNLVHKCVFTVNA